jgi:hypothetical protein
MAFKRSTARADHVSAAVTEHPKRLFHQLNRRAAVGTAPGTKGLRLKLDILSIQPGEGEGEQLLGSLRAERPTPSGMVIGG